MVGVEEYVPSIPGLEQEPLDPFYDDVFGGLDEPTAGPWPHHSMLDCPPELHPALEHPTADSHFPAIDCNLLEEQVHAGATEAADLQHGQGSSISGSLHLEPPCCLAEHLHASCHTAAEEQGAEQEQGAEHLEAPSSSRLSEAPQHAEVDEGALPLDPDAHQHGSACSTSSGQDQAVSAAGNAACSAQEPGAVAELAQSCHAGAAAAAATGGECRAGAAAAAAAGASMHAADSSDCSTSPADLTAAVAATVAEVAVPEGEPSSGSSLPDIDDVPEDQAGLQEPQQQGDCMVQLQENACSDPWRQQQQGESYMQEQTGVPAHEPVGAPLACSTGSLGVPAEAEGGCRVGSDGEAGTSCSPPCSAAALAAVPGCSTSAEQACPEQQQLSVPADDDFASPCSSWHSCVTASSNQASSNSMTSRRGFFLPQPPAAASAAAPAEAAAGAGVGVGVVLTAGIRGGPCNDGPEPDQQDQQDQQEPSTGGISSPPLVSSLHLALQQQQWQSQHSEQLAASAVSDDPLTAGLALSVSSLAAGMAERPDHTATAAAGADAEHGSSAASACAAAGSQPIAMPRLHQQEELWQDVSPPSFSSSPGLLVSAVAAREVAAAAQQEQQQQEAVSAGAVDAAAETAETAAEQQEGRDVVNVAEDDVGHGCFYAAAADGLSMSPEQGFLQQHMAMLQHRGPGLHQQQHLNNSSYMLRQSELVDLSLSTSMHPSQLQHMQQQALQHPGWLTAHQQLPPAAAQAVERAVVALNDSYCSPSGRTSPSEVLGAAVGSRGGSSAAAIRRSGAGQQWNRAHTQPQQDQQARHRLPSQAAAGGPAGPFGWPGAAVLGDWFSSTVQQPLAAAASRAAVGVGQRLGMAQHPGLPGSGRQHSNSSWTGGGVQAGSGAAQGPGVLSQGAAGSSGVGSSGMSRLGVVEGGAAVTGLGGAEVLEDSLDDAVLVEKTSDLPQSLQEQEDEAFRGLLFLGGRDSQGRPVVIINTDAIPAGHNSAPRDAALAYLLKRLSPVVTRGPYVLVIVALHHGPQFRLLPGVWCVRAYQSLPRAFRKHVKHVILLEPSMLVKAAVTLLYPFVSSKAHAKVKQVQRLLDIEAATCGEVQVPHLGEAFLTTIHHINSSRSHHPDSTA